MRYATFVGALLGAVFAITLVAATPALANDPEWVICELTATGKLDAECGNGSMGKFEEVFLAEKKSKEMKGEENGAQVLKLMGIEAECTKLKLKAGALALGSKLPKAGTAKETIEFAGCTIMASPNCKIDGADPGEYDSGPLIGTLDFKTKVAAEKLDAASAVLLLEAEPGGKFAEIKLSGECPKGEQTIVVEGNMAFEIRLANTFAKVHELAGPSTAIKPVWLWVKAGEVKEIPVKLGVAGLEATYVGKSKFSFAGEPFWAIEAL